MGSAFESRSASDAQLTTSDGSGGETRVKVQRLSDDLLASHDHRRISPAAHECQVERNEAVVEELAHNFARLGIWVANVWFEFFTTLMIEPCCETVSVLVPSG